MEKFTEPSLDIQIEQLLPSDGSEFKLLSEKDMKELCEHAKGCLRDEQNVVPIPAPVTVVGANHELRCAYVAGSESELARGCATQVS